MKRFLLFAVLMAVLSASASFAAFGSQSPASAACLRSLPVTHTSNHVDMYAAQTCGYSYRAWGNWGGEIDYGTYRSTNGLHSVACDITTCQSHPDGTLNDGGYQVKRTGRYVCTFGCASAIRTK